MKKAIKRVLGMLLATALVVELVPVSVIPKEVSAAEENTTEEVVQVAAPTFSKESGNYKEGFDLTLSAAEGTTIYYSTDGSVPSPERLAEGDSKIYTYSNAIQVKDRTGEANVLATKENAIAMNQLYNEANKRYIATDAQVAKSTVIRAMAVDAEGNCSPVVTKSYFVGNNLTTKYKDMVVVSLTTDPKNLMDDDIGIFVTGNNENYNQHGKTWEREAALEFYEPDGSIGFTENVGIRVRGGYTRQYQQKSFNVYFREEYGNKNLKYELFPGEMNYEGTEEVKKFKGFMLRNGGNDIYRTKMRDVFIQSLVRDRNLTTQGYRTCIVYLNGEYWGVYNIQEKQDDNWMESEFGIDKDNLVIIKDGEVEEGEDTDIELYNELRALGELDMTQAENYEKFLDAVELQSYVDYYAVETLIGNKDWGFTKNNQFWRSRVVGENEYEDTKWRWVLHDTDQGMRVYGAQLDDPFAQMKKNGEDGLENDPLFLAVMKNDEFKKVFVNTVMDLLNENFNYTKNISKYEALKAVYEKIMPEQNIRFGNDWASSDMGAFNGSTQDFVDAWKDMDSWMKGLLKTYFSAKNTAKVSVSTNMTSAENVTINTLTESVKDGAWTGTYYQEVPVTVSAPVVDGLQFEKWEVTGGTATDATAATTQITLTASNATIKAVYKEGSAAVNPEITPRPETSPSPEVTPGATQAPGSTTPAPTMVPGLQGTTDTPSNPNTTVAQPDDVKEETVLAVKKATVKKVTSSKKKTMKVKIKKIVADGYQVVYATNKKFTKGKKTKNTKKTTVTIKKLKRKKTYYVKVRAYRINKDGEKVYGKFSKVKKVKIK